MKIGFIEDTHLHGGTQIWVTEAIRAFLARGHSITLLAPENSWIVKECENLGISTFTYDWAAVTSESRGDIAIWTEALAQCDLAVCTVHPPREGFHCSVFAARCIKEAGLETHLLPKTGTIVPEYERRFYQPDAAINSSIIAIAEFTRRYLIETHQIDEELIKLIYQGVDTRRFKSSAVTREGAIRRYPLPEDAAPILASVGTFEPRKGHLILLEAVAKLVKGSLPKIHVMVVGDGPDETLLKRKVEESGIQNNCSFFPFTSKPNYVFERADVTVLSSLYKEGLPNVLQESMAMNVPVVSTNLGGVPEIVLEGETGYMVEPGSSDQLAEAVLTLWSDQKKYRHMRRRARALIAERFDKERQFERFLAHFTDLVDKPQQVGR